jgi:predicted LPLAT superfamily acyltransferase
MRARSNVHWAHMQERTCLWGLRFMCALHRRCGNGPFFLMLYPVVFYYWVTHPRARRASLQYLTRMQATQGNSSRVPNSYTSLQHFFSFAHTILDKTLALSGRYAFTALRFKGRECMQQALSQGQGGVIVTAHMGCLEMCQAAARDFGKAKINVLVHLDHAEKFNRLLNQLDPDRRVQLVPISALTPATAVMLAERVAQGEFIAIAGDRVPVHSQQTASVTFLGHTARLPVGPYVLAALLKCPLFLMGCLREGATHTLYFEQLAHTLHLPRKERTQALQNQAQLYASRLEALLKQAPLEWFNFFAFWDQ